MEHRLKLRNSAHTVLLLKNVLNMTEEANVDNIVKRVFVKEHPFEVQKGD